MKHPNPLMLLRIAQGDAFGMATEYIKFPRDQRVYDQALKFERYVKHPTHKLDAGQYTDDTQMSVAVSEVLLDYGDPFQRLDLGTIPVLGAEMRVLFAESFVRCFKRDVRDGYSRGFQAFLESITDGAEFLRTIKADSDKNGAAMRSVPIGVLPNPLACIMVAETQAKLTHDTPGGIESSVLVALMSHFALWYDEPFRDMDEFLATFEFEVEFPPWDGRPVTGPGVGINTARAVKTLLETERTLLGIAKKTIEWGGDTDSVLAIAWGIASARMDDELPAFFEGGLEDGSYGRAFLRGLGARLMQKFAAMWCSIANPIA